MKNSEINKTFITTVDKRVVDAALSNIADYYGISNSEAKAELIHDEAEHILDYLTGNTRTATHVIMQRHNLI